MPRNPPGGWSRRSVKRLRCGGELEAAMRRASMSDERARHPARAAPPPVVSRASSRSMPPSMTSACRVTGRCPPSVARITSSAIRVMHASGGRRPRPVHHERWHLASSNKWDIRCRLPCPGRTGPTPSDGVDCRHRLEPEAAPAILALVVLLGEHHAAAKPLQGMRWLFLQPRAPKAPRESSDVADTGSHRMWSDDPWPSLSLGASGGLRILASGPRGCAGTPTTGRSPAYGADELPGAAT